MGNASSKSFRRRESRVGSSKPQKNHGDDDASRTTNTSSHSHSRKGKILDKKTKKKPRPKTEAQKVVVNFIKSADNKDALYMYKVINENAMFRFPDTGVEMPMTAFVDALRGLLEAFPDMSFRYSAIEEPMPGLVILRNYVGGGTHCGSSYSFPPHPPIPPTGLYIEDEPITLSFQVRNDKIVDCQCEAGGKLVGPPGFYAKCKLASEGIDTKGI